jgi:hypothetical protein
MSRATGSSGHGHDGGSGPSGGRDRGGCFAHDAESGPDCDTVPDLGLEGATGSGAGTGLRAAARRAISQRMMVTTTATAVAAAIARNPPAIHSAALILSPDWEGPVFCSWIRPAATAPAR